MKWKKYGIQIIVGLLIVAGLAVGSGLGKQELAEDVVKILCDSFFVIAVMYLGIGSLLWVSTTGFFDIFGFAIGHAAHTLIPGMVKEIESDFYTYKMTKADKRTEKPLLSTFIVGVLFLIISIILNVIWFQIAE